MSRPATPPGAPPPDPAATSPAATPPETAPKPPRGSAGNPPGVDVRGVFGGRDGPRPIPTPALGVDGHPDSLAPPASTPPGAPPPDPARLDPDPPRPPLFAPGGEWTARRTMFTGRPVIIVDLDNCISDDSWRRGRIAKQRGVHAYDDYHQLAGFDPVRNTDVVCRRDVDVIIMTGRPVFYRALTEQWLEMNGVPFVHLMMRNNNDRRPSLVLKEQMVGWLWAYNVDTDNVLCAYDDRRDIVDMYRKSYGLHAERLWIENRP